MFQLYKVRNFNTLINDTFMFFKVSGKNYFKNYFIINGPLLLILAVVCFIMVKVFFENIFSGIANANSTALIENYVEENSGLMITMAILTGTVGLLAMMINYSYPVIYMKLSENNEKPDTRTIFKAILGKMGKIILFGLCTLITFVPIAIMVGVFAVLMVVIIIGIPVAIILFAAFACWMYLTFYDYITTDNGYFTSMGNGWNMLFKSFWAHMGSTAIFFAMLYVFQMLVMIVSFMIQAITGLMSTVDTNPEGALETMSVFMIAGFVIQTIISFITGNLLVVNQGIIYYSCREQDESHSLNNEIDLIGSNVE